MRCQAVCPSAYSPITFCPTCNTFVAAMEPIRCIDCGEVIAQYEHIIENGIEWWGYRDTIARINSADSLRCGGCYERHTFGRKYAL